MGRPAPRSLSLALLACALVACAPVALRRPETVPGVPGPWPAQALYRVRYEGPSGKGSLRLVLRQLSAERFQLLTSDALGRAAWSLELWDDGVLLIDHRERSGCVAGSELRVPELALRALPLMAVPRVLDGRAPVPAPAGTADPSDWTDDTGQRWTLRREAGQLRGWTLWQEGEPRLSWVRQPGGGVLSHLDGAQFRWRQVTRERLSPAGYRRLEVPPDLPLGRCETDLPRAPAEVGAAG